MLLLVRLLWLALGAICLLTPLRSHAQIEGKYIGIYQFYRMSFMPAELDLEKKGRKGFEGVITFSHFENSVGMTVVRSSFAVRTTYNTDRKTVRLIFVKWIDEPTYGDFDLGVRQGRLQTSGQVLSGDGFEFALEGSPEGERAVRQRKLFELQALAQRRADDEYKKRNGQYDRELQQEIGKAATQAPEPADKRRRRSGGS
jgi:hypothetical protein